MGGHAFPDAVPMTREAAERIVERLESATGWSLTPVGSFPFKKRLPDLDLVVPEADFNHDALARLGETMTYNMGGSGLKVEHEGRFHQVDFFPVASLEWGKFARAGASDNGELRILILRAAAATFAWPGQDWHLWVGDMHAARAGRTLDQRRGLRRLYQHRIRKRGQGFLKNPKTVDATEFRRLFPRAPRLEEPDVLTDPAEVSQLILGSPGPWATADKLAAHVRARLPEDRVRRMDRLLRERKYALP